MEVLPFANKSVQIQVARMGGRATLREATGKVGPVVTDNGNFILDADFGRIKNPPLLQRRLKEVPGLLETGLFLNLADVIYVGRRNGEVQVLE